MIDLTRVDVRRSLFSLLIDDAALFPPREASLGEAVHEHAARRIGQYAFLQRSFVVSVARLPALRRLAAAARLPMRLSVVIGLSELADNLTLLRQADLAMLEIRLPSAEIPLADLRRACEQVAELGAGRRIDVFFESAQMLQRPGEPTRLANRLLQLRSDGPRAIGAKLRTGGVTNDATPSSDLVAHFVAAMNEHRIPWKATAGLHHPVRGVYNGQPMHGFLNVLGAACGAFTGAFDHAQLVELLDDADPSAFGLSEDALHWRAHRFGPEVIRPARETFRSFGSCSFDEPVAGLRELRMLGLE